MNDDKNDKLLRVETEFSGDTLSYSDFSQSPSDQPELSSSGQSRVIGQFSGAASLLCKINSYGYLFAPNAFDNCIEHLKTHGVVAGLNHDWDKPAGLISDARVILDDNPRLMVTAQIIDTQSGHLVQKLIGTPVGANRGAIRSLSIGHKVLKYKRYEKPEEIKKLWDSWGYKPTGRDLESLEVLTTTYRLGNGIEYTPGVEVIEESRVFEVSPVLAPGQFGAGIDQVLNLIREGQLVPKEHAPESGSNLVDVKPEESPQSEPTPEKFMSDEQIEQLLREAKKRV